LEKGLLCYLYSVIHFKSDCSLLDSETILATSRLSAAECFAPFRVLTVPPGEEAAANSIRVNDKVLVPAGFPATAELISRAAYAVEVVKADQAALLDGGLSCMSLRFGCLQANRVSKIQTLYCQILHLHNNYGCLRLPEGPVVIGKFDLRSFADMGICHGNVSNFTQ